MELDILSDFIEGSPNEVWSILLKNGLELVSRVRQEKDTSPDGTISYVLERPLQIRAVHVPMSNGQGGIHVSTSGQAQPLFFFLQIKELPVTSEEIWAISPSIKSLRDGYIQQTTGIAVS